MSKHRWKKASCGSMLCMNMPSVEGSVHNDAVLCIGGNYPMYEIEASWQKFSGTLFYNRYINPRNLRIRTTF